MGEVEARRLDQLALGANVLKEHDQLQLEEDHRINGGTVPFGVLLPCPLADEGEIELGFQVTVEVIPGDEILQRDGNDLIETAGFGRSEHGVLQRGD